MSASQAEVDSVNSKYQEEDERKRKISGDLKDEHEDSGSESEISKSSGSKIAQENPENSENVHTNGSNVPKINKKGEDENLKEENDGKRKQRKVIALQADTEDPSTTNIHEEESSLKKLSINRAEEAKTIPPTDKATSIAKPEPGQRIFGSGILVGGFSASSAASPFSMFSSTSTSGKPAESFLLPKSKSTDENVATVTETELLDHINEPSLSPLQAVDNVPSGEEEDDILLQLRAKLYFMSASDTKKDWKERGIGMLHLNQNTTDPKLHRLVMRTDATLKLILNIRVTANLLFEIIQDKNVRFIGSDNSIPGMYLLRFNTATNALDFLEKIQFVLHDKDGKSEDA